MPGSDDAVRKLNELLSREADAFGPHVLDDDDEPVANMPDAHLSEWVVVMAWTDAATGRSILTRASSPGLPRHHEQGLLHEALHGAFD